VKIRAPRRREAPGPDLFSLAAVAEAVAAKVLTPQQEAEANQLAASHPGVSAFVDASAGSGKTRLLTDRILRLMVGGARPERVLCLTFTKAAAAEMAVRLQRRLGLWVTLDRAALREELLKLDIEPSGATMARARSLFAHVLDLPGGMRIGTIHAFCQSLLRRFPLEAEISPHFQLAEDRDADEAMTEAREDLLASVRPRGASNALSDLELALRALAGVTTLDRFSKLVTMLKNDRERWRLAQAAGPELAAARRRLLGVAAPDRDAVIAAAVRGGNETALRAAARAVAATSGAATVKEKAGAILQWLALTAAERAAAWETWRRFYLRADGQPYARKSFVNDALARTDPGLLPPFLDEAERVRAVDDQISAADTAALSDALCSLAKPLLDRFEHRKQAAGLLEFDDLITRSTDLLANPGADWVLYKLDGGLDHLLLDEVQDTAPEQWAIAHGLTQGFFAGQGARDGIARTVFAVGDRKQSIFSFQGADVAGFEDARGKLGARVTQAGLDWVERPLNVSFRSTAPVLALVDAVFADPAAAAGVELPGRTLSHRAVRAGHAGRVELWPLAEAPPPEPPTAWTAPERYQRATSALQVLADGLAGWIAGQTGGSVLLESKGRPLRPGDVMILVRHRDALPAALVRSLKSRGVPVSGLDRMVLTEQPAVQDLMVLGDALLLPQDDLSFASVLTSPLGGLDDNDLMALAIGRQQPLWETLRDRHDETPAWTRAWSFFSALLNRADYVSPHALFAEALGAAGGRARLLARLGSEAAEPIDELLNAALRYSKIHPPSLQGFLQWLRRSGAEIKREAEAAGGQVRILTVHGAKGLQAPLVILPDTTSMPKDDDELLWAEDRISGNRGGGWAVPIWAPRAEFHCDTTRRLRDAARQRRREEYNRLLYVALTRAEDRLVVCGAKPKQGAPNDGCWYNLIARGFSRLTGAPEGEVVRFDSPQTAPIEREPAAPAASDAAHLPAFIGKPPHPEPARPLPLAPSRPEGVEFGPVPASASPLAQVEHGVDRFQRGQLIHSLLQHLPALPEPQRPAAALRFLERAGRDLPADAHPGIVDEVMAILHHPTLAQLFGPESRAEVPLTGVVGDVVVGGLIDRLAVLPDRVLLADFKTNRRPPVSVEATPVAYLRQMASYRAVLRTIFPQLPVHCALIWTREARVSLLPDGILDPHDIGRRAGGSVPGAGQTGVLQPKS
jgi:ATP-dependent helicase/nuclease subunit A